MSYLESFPSSSARAFGRKTQISQRPKIGLLDHLGGGNLGDDALLDATIYNIKKRWSRAELHGFSMNPDDTRERHGLPCYPIRTKNWALGGDIHVDTLSARSRFKAATRNYPLVFWPLKALHSAFVRIPLGVVRELRFCARSFRNLKSFDLLIINGGGQLTEAAGGAWNFPYTIFRWAQLARMADVPCIVLNVGAGPLTRPLSKYFVRHALRSADYVSFRNEESRALVRDIGYRGKTAVYPDNAYGLDLSRLVSGGSCDQRATVGLAPMAYSDPRVNRNASPAVYKGLIQALGLFGSWLIEQGYLLKLFCSDIGVDPPAVQDLHRSLQQSASAKYDQSIAAAQVTSNADLLMALSSMDYVVTCRFHGVVFAHLMNKPVLALSHHPKVSSLMNDLGLSRYCVDITTSDVDVLKNAFCSLVTNTDAIKTLMAERLSGYRKQLSRQFDFLFPSLHAERTDGKNVRSLKHACR